MKASRERGAKNPECSQADERTPRLARTLYLESQAAPAWCSPPALSRRRLFSLSATRNEFTLRIDLAFAFIACAVLVGCAQRDSHVASAADAARENSVDVARANVQDAAALAASARAPRVRPACGSDGPYNVVLLSIDSLRGDIFHPRGNEAPVAARIAPALSRFATSAVDFTRAHALSSYTSMSVGGFLGARLPSELARSGFFFGHYPDSVEMFPELLHAAGVRTLAAHAHWYFGRGSAGFEQGFDVWELVPNLHHNNLTDVDITSVQHEAIAERLLSDSANTSGRFFAWFHFMDPHDEYNAHEGIGPYGRRARDRYDGEVTFADRTVGRLLAFIDRQAWAARTVVMITADHGEAFGEHGHFRHAFELWQELVHVPWMIRMPGATPHVVDRSRSHADLAPTVLALLGVQPAPSAWRGRSLVDEVCGADGGERDVWIDLARTSNNSRRRVLIHSNVKIIAYGENEHFDVFDLRTDPGELHPLRLTDPTAHADAVQRYRAGQAAIHPIEPYGLRPRANP